MAGQKEVDNLLQNDPFLRGPGDYLCLKIKELISTTPEWRQMFGENIDAYERFDYPIRSLPALRVFNLEYRKEHESHYITGELKVDILLPPSIRRLELQQVQDFLSHAMIQQFRNPTFFSAMRDALPGLNELGKTVGIDKSLGMQYEEDVLPMTRMTPNFRLDLKEWDAYLERESRTKDKPFERTLGALRTLATSIRGLNDDETDNVTVTIEQTVGGS